MIVWWCKHDSEPSNAWRSRKCCTLWSLNNSRVLRHGLHKTCMQVSSNKIRVAQLSPEVLLFALSRTHSLLEADPCAHLHPDCRCDWRLSSKVILICQVRCSMLSHVLNSCRPAMNGHTVLAKVWLRLGRLSHKFSYVEVALPSWCCSGCILGWTVLHGKYGPRPFFHLIQPIG